MDRPLVIKIGGSLLSHAGPIIQAILSYPGRFLILPGGGVFADAVRNTKAEGTPAHWMAIAGMEQYGWYLSSFGIKTTDTPEFGDTPCIFLPYRYLRTHDPLPHSWDVTSDTISAWIAARLSAGLLILKSVDQVRAENTPVDQITALIPTCDLDSCFIPFILQNNVSGVIINGSVPERITHTLQGIPVLGTRFGITI